MSYPPDVDIDEASDLIDFKLRENAAADYELAAKAGIGSDEIRPDRIKEIACDFRLARTWVYSVLMRSTKSQWPRFSECPIPESRIYPVVKWLSENPSMLDFVHGQMTFAESGTDDRHLFGSNGGSSTRTKVYKATVDRLLSELSDLLTVR